MIGRKRALRPTEHTQRTPQSPSRNFALRYFPYSGFRLVTRPNAEPIVLISSVVIVGRFSAELGEYGSVIRPDMIALRRQSWYRSPNSGNRSDETPSSMMARFTIQGGNDLSPPYQTSSCNVENSVVRFNAQRFAIAFANSVVVTPVFGPVRDSCDV